MTLFYPNSTACQSLLRASILSFPRISLQRTRTTLFLGFRPISVRVELNGFTDSSGDGDIIDSARRGDKIECHDECVEVVVVGSRKDAMLDFCSGSPFVSPALRFWNIVGHDSESPRLQQRLTKKDYTPTIIEDSFNQQCSCKAFILVASAAYGSDHITALDVISSIKSNNVLVVGIILKPFSFEGQRRQNEVKDLVGKLQKQANFCIILDTDTLLENDLVTLDEALSTSNNAVLMAINAISIIISERYEKLLNGKDNSTRELQLPEFRKIVENYDEARIGFGAGYNVKASLLRSINDCPFLGVDVKDIDGVVVCIFSSSDATVCSSDTNTILRTVRQILGCNVQVILSVVHEPSLEPKKISTTIIAFGCSRQKLPPSNGILSSLGQHFPFLLNIFKKKFQQSISNEEIYSSQKSDVSDGVHSSIIGDMFDENSSDLTTEDVESFKTQPRLGNPDEEFDSFSSSSAYGDIDLRESSIYDINAEEPPMLKRELLSRGNLGNDQSARSLNYEANLPEATVLVDNINIYKLPVGVKHLDKYEDTVLTSNPKQLAEGIADENKRKQPNTSLSGFTEASDFSLADFNNNISTFKKGNLASNSKKQGGLSVRAASMLESERDSEKKWNRVVEMKYRGGIYKGRAQGGLPEGKGRLLLGDGNLYDGMWRYGKRSGLGTFCFRNGDVFQGSWRDDVMHGKGWFYFHTGDRWFANFWKGKANGEGRFYSKLGDVSFGHFKEGWRHGHFLRINVDGTRTREIWDEGVLVGEEALDIRSLDG